MLRTDKTRTDKGTISNFANLPISYDTFYWTYDLIDFVYDRDSDLIRKRRDTLTINVNELGTVSSHAPLVAKWRHGVITLFEPKFELSAYGILVSRYLRESIERLTTYVSGAYSYRA